MATRSRRRAYEQALRTIAAPAVRDHALLGQVEAAHVEAAARARLRVVRGGAVAV